MLNSYCFQVANQRIDHVVKVAYPYLVVAVMQSVWNRRLSCDHGRHVENWTEKPAVFFVLRYVWPRSLRSTDFEYDSEDAYPRWRLFQNIDRFFTVFPIFCRLSSWFCVGSFVNLLQMSGNVQVCIITVHKCAYIVLASMHARVSVVHFAFQQCKH